MGTLSVEVRTRGPIAPIGPLTIVGAVIEGIPGRGFLLFLAFHTKEIKGKPTKSSKPKKKRDLVLTIVNTKETTHTKKKQEKDRHGPDRQGPDGQGPDRQGPGRQGPDRQGPVRAI